MTKKSRRFASALLVAGLLAAGAASAKNVTWGYPSADNASFLIDAPEDWEPAPGEEVGDYFELYGPTGVALSFRTVPGTEDALKTAVEESIAYLHETYTDVKLDPAKDSVQAGLEGFYGTGSGVDEEGTKVVFGLAWYQLEDGNIGEIWFVAEAGDTAGAKAAGKILESFRAP